MRPALGVVHERRVTDHA